MSPRSNISPLLAIALALPSLLHAQDAAKVSEIALRSSPFAQDDETTSSPTTDEEITDLLVADTSKDTAKVSEIAPRSSTLAQDDETTSSPLAQDDETTSSPTTDEEITDLPVADTIKDTIPALSVEDTTNDATTTPETEEPPGFNDEAICGPRVRRPWSLLSNDDKQLFKDAVAMSMSSGLWADFTVIHIEAKNKIQAHESCGFLVWHRAFLLAMENHLRSLSDTFACVTIPTWDIFDEFTAQYNGDTCSDFATCSPIINDICGLPVGEKQKRSFDNTEVEGMLSNEAPCNSFCPLNSDGDAECGVLRNVDGKPIPVNIGFAQLGLMFKTAHSYKDFSSQLIGPMHSSMHSAVNGHMTTYASSVDPLFYIWHATIDSLLYKFHQCKVGKAPLDAGTLATNKYAYATCLHGKALTAGVDPAPTLTTPLSFLLSKSVATQQVATAISKSPVAELFDVVGKEFYEYVDARSLESGYSYSYEFTPAFDEQFTKEILKADGTCPGYEADEATLDITTDKKSNDNSKTAPSDDDSKTAPSDDDSTKNVPSGDVSVELKVDAQGMTYERWTSNVQNQLKTVFPNDTIAVAKYQAYLACIDFYSENPDVDFSAEFNKDMPGIGEDQCKEKAKEAIATGEVNIIAASHAEIPNVASPAITKEVVISSNDIVQQQREIIVKEMQKETIAEKKSC